jgi:glyoxylase-like metal-dependent hydrolase (beta-lactamase superfamily II)
MAGIHRGGWWRSHCTRAGVSVDKIWLTHDHVDHVAAATDLKKNLKVSIEGPHKDDLFLLQHVAETGRSYGMWDASNVFIAIAATSLTDSTCGMRRLRLHPLLRRGAVRTMPQAGSHATDQA